MGIRISEGESMPLEKRESGNQRKLLVSFLKCFSPTKSLGAIASFQTSLFSLTGSQMTFSSLMQLVASFTRIQSEGLFP